MLIRNVSALTFASLLVGGAASAQSTLTLSTSNEVTDAFIRGGTYANTVYNTDALATKANSTIQNVRRALLKFDTETLITQGARIQSATLTLTLKTSDPETRRIGVYRVTQSFQEDEATWNRRKTGYNWTAAGSDLSSKLTEFSIGTTLGTKVSVDVTSVVQSTVNGSYGSRYTRLALVDVGSSSNTSYKEFHSSETATSSNRPVLTIVFGSTSTPPPPPPPPPAPTGSTLKVLEWNTHYGMGTDGVYNLDRIATKIASMNPDVIALTEVTRRSHYSATDDGPARYASLLTAKTGRTWYYVYRTDNGAPTGVGNAVLSRFPIDSTSHCQLSTRRVAVRAANVVNGRTVNVWSTHLDSNTGNSMRLTEVRALLPCMAAFAEQKIVAGDFNSQSTSSELALVKAAFYDGWAEADADGTATCYTGNSRYGATRNSRIDYIFYSKAASALDLQSARVYDTRDSSGVMPSDHKPLMVTFQVR